MQKRARIYGILGSSEFDRRVHEGISGYLAEKAPEMELEVHLDHPKDNSQPSVGIITRVMEPEDIPQLLAYKVPVVNITNRLESPGFPSVLCDAALGGRLAAEHLLARRFHHFGYYGKSIVRFAALQSQSFEQTIKTAGFSASLHFSSWENDTFVVDPIHQQKLQTWLANLPKPVGICCVSDRYAWELAKACDALDLIISKDVGIVGCGNEEFFCKTRFPQLSSLDTYPIRVGYEAAALLLRLINGESPPAEPILIPPSIIARASSDIFATDDPHVTMAIKFIQDHIKEPLSAQIVFDHVPLSRDSLERRFRKHLEYSVLETIHLLKIDRVKELLVSTSRNMEEIATATGLSGGTYMGVLFREKVGVTPSEYRNQFKPESSSTRCA